MLRKQIIGWLAAGVFVTLCGAWNARAQSPEEIGKIEAAMPARATVKPTKAHRVLVFSLCTGFKHSAVPYGEKMLEIMGRKTGTYSVDITTSTDVFKPEKLKNYDAIVMNNCTGENFAPGEGREALLSFVRDGKGLIGIHAATDCEYQWPEYGEMIGGYFDGHPWGAGDTVVVKVDEPDHPLTKAFEGKELTVKEEIYQFKDPYSRSRSRVLTTLNVDKIDMKKKGIKRADNDFAVSWVHPYGKGRVFYCSLGHNHDLFWNPVVLQHYLDGIQFALGDLKADASPRRKVAQEMLLKGFPAALRDTAQCVVGGNEKFSAVDGMIRSAGPEPAVRKEMAKQIASFLKAPGDTPLTLAAKQFLSEKLSEIGSEEEASALVPMLVGEDADASDAARRALERLPGESVNRILREAVEKARGQAQIGVVLALGTRRDKGAVDLLLGPAERTGLKHAVGTTSAGQELADACLWSLGQIGTPEALRGLERIWIESRQKSEPAGAALVECADRLQRSGRQKDALELYRKLYEQKDTAPVRAAALLRLAELTGDAGKRLALESLFEEDSLVRKAAAGVVMGMKGTGVTAELMRRLPKLTTESQVVVLGILSARGDRGALRVVRDKARDADEPVRVAALRGLGELGDASVAGLLLESAADSEGGERDAARASLGKLADGDVNAKILSVLQEAGDKAAGRRSEAVRALLARRAKDALPAILKATEDPDASVKEQAWTALAEMAEPAQLKTMARLLRDIDSGKVATAAEKAVVETARRIEDESKRADDVVAGLKNTHDGGSSPVFYRVLSRIGNDKSLEELRAAWRDTRQSEEQRDALVRGLVDFPGSKALADVFDIARNSKSEVHRVLAIRGLARLLALPSDRPTSETVVHCREALELASRPEDKKAVIGGLAEIPQPEVLLLVTPFLDSPELREEAAAAALKLAEGTSSFVPEEADKALEKIATTSSDKELQKRAEKLRKSLQAGDGIIAGWRAAGPYESAGKGPKELLDMAFAPESSERQDIVWKPVGTKKGPKNAHVVELGEVYGGDNRVVYLRARINAQKACEARLQVGSDDGAKIWLNGKMVKQSAAATRPYKADQDKIDVTLREGWNHLMVKVVQGKAEWRASARVVSRSGKKIEGVKTDALDVQDTKAFVGEPSGSPKGR